MLTAAMIAPSTMAPASKAAIGTTSRTLFLQPRRIGLRNRPCKISAVQDDKNNEGSNPVKDLTDKIMENIPLSGDDSPFNQQNNPLKGEGGKPKPFEMQDQALQTPAIVPAFTRRREHFVGRIAALGMASALTGELLAGVGPITQLQYETGINKVFLYILLTAIIAYGGLGTGIGTPTYSRSNQQDVNRRDTINPTEDPRKGLLQAEIWVGRLAMVGFAGACLLEFLWGGDAPLVHLGLVQPVSSLTHAPWWLVGMIGVFAATGLGLLTGASEGRTDDNAY